MDEKLYRYEKEKNQLKMIPALPNDKLMEAILNSPDVMQHSRAGEIMKKVIDMEWKYLERRWIKWMGDSASSRSIQQGLRDHIKAEKKWIAKGAKVEHAV